eukprot:CAMPEP_0185043042 /NCGR_PEP_ID=MMETSP1103-20130426/42689_1 /TAXON_ID=36769 /ORGANISM="Paraphysomonas bandaiensis, Strain Caron Lab Isolate" /LENGTH=365 /DNA_ID=CAMNT_0027583183 /DNA_START=538 /DNA_END=1635 /DNA_ORIENTATION=+
MATSFFIPYDIGIDASYSKDGKLRRTNCPRSYEVSRLLFASPYFSKRGGHDHFLLHSINQPMRFFNNQPACYDFLTRICTNCTKLSIDSYPKGYDRTSYMPNWHSIPFPSNYHWSSSVTHPPWADFSRPRPYAVSYIGSMSSHLKKSRTLREILRRECRESEYRYPGLCRWYDLSHHGSSADALSPNHTSQSNMWRAAEDSTFCITPPGDFPTRKGFFDSLLAGCIPVVFAPLSAHRQWPWHLGLSSTFAVTVYVSGQRVLDQSLNTVQYLIDKHLFEKDEVYMKRRAIADLAFGLQYSMPERGMNNTEFSRNDAFDITIESILQLHRVAERRWEQSIEIGDHIDRGLVPYDISFSYNIHKNDIR